jgi:GGDEF domain-containing protein
VFTREHRCEWRERAEELSNELARTRAESALVDPATGVGNAPALQLHFHKFLARWRRLGEPFTVCLVSFLDPRAPDGALPAKAAAQLGLILVQSARVEDSVFRVSTNEFVVLLANSTAEGGAAFLTRARNQVAREPIRTEEGSRFYRSAGGVAEWSDAIASLSGLLEVAAEDMERLHSEIRRVSEEYLPTV